MTPRRPLPLAATILLAVLGLSGCVAIKTEGSSTRAPGVVAINLSVCASHRVSGSNCIPSPDATPGQTVNTAEGDNSLDAPNPDPNSDPIKGQLLVGFRLPTGTIGPTQFTSGTGEVFSRSDGYTSALNSVLAPPTGFRWIGYISSSVTLTAGTSLSSLSVEFTLPAATADGGSPFVSPFRWRAVVGTIGVGGDPSTCSGGTICFDSPQAANLAGQFNQAVSDFRVKPGQASQPVAPGQTANLSFPVVYADNNGFGSRTLKISGSSTLPGNPKIIPASPTLPIAGNQTPTETAMVTVPAGTTPGSYRVTLTTTDAASGVTRSNTATLTVVDKTPPTISIGSPTAGEVLTQGQRIGATYRCADEPNGSGLASCAGTVPNGAALDTAAPGQKTFTVTARDKAGNAASVTRTYTVQAPPPPVVVSVTRKQINISLSYLFAAGGKSTRFKSLTVKGVPKGATVRVTCKGKGCPAKSFTKKKASGSVSLKPFVKKALKKGIVLTVSVTKPKFVGMVKTLTIRASKAPKVTTACLQPGAKRAKRCA